MGPAIVVALVNVVAAVKLVMETKAKKDRAKKNESLE